jgi:Amt family ammonium transporter
MEEIKVLSLINSLEQKISQVELNYKGSLKAAEFKISAILQSNIDTLWLLICAILVFLMQAGFMCLESGLARKKNNINVALKNIADFGVSVGAYWAFGFALMFGMSVNGLFGSNFFFFTTNNAGYQAFFVFQTMFVATAATIISGAVAERLKFYSYIIITLITSGLIYPVVGHWVWSYDFTNPSIKFGWLGKIGFIDFAGSSVVHSVGGWVALAVLLIIGNRTGRFRKGAARNQFQGSNTPIAALGALILWFGWFGFNGGANLEVNLKIPLILINTFLAASFGLIFSSIVGIYFTKKPEPLFMISGPLAGLVAVTASCAYIAPASSIIIGSVAGVLSSLSIIFLEKLEIDDVVGAIPVHLVAGVWGTLAVAFFVDLDLINLEKSRWEILLTQFIGVLSIGAFCFGSSYIILSILNKIYPLRVNKIEEELGLNISEHNASTDTHKLLQVLNEQAQKEDYSLRAPQDPFTESGLIGRQYNVLMNKLEQSEKFKNIWRNRVSQEIKLATEVQQKLMPKRDLSQYPVFGINIPAREISGDFYDFYFHDKEVYFILSDVSGKGVNSGMVMARAITLFKIFARLKYSPCEILFEINNELNDSNTRGMFVTSIVGCYNLDSNDIEFANAGHQPALYEKNGKIKDYPSSCPPLGIIKQKNIKIYKVEKINLNQGRFYCFTDGFSESLNENNEEIGVEGVSDLILKYSNKDLKSQLSCVTEKIREKVISLSKKNTESFKDSGNILDDDLTIIGIGK